MPATAVAIPMGSVSAMKMTTAEQELIEACKELQWRDREDAVDRLLSTLSWWLDTKDENSAALVVSGLKAEIHVSRESTRRLEKVMLATASTSVDDLIKRWDEMEAMAAYG